MTAGLRLGGDVVTVDADELEELVRGYHRHARTINDVIVVCGCGERFAGHAIATDGHSAHVEGRVRDARNGRLS